MIRFDINNNGFSLIELILVLMISGILVLFGSLGITSAVDSYFTQKNNSETAYKGQLAMMRISKEMKNLASATSGTTKAIVYKNYREGALETHKLSWTGTSGDPLLYDDFSKNGNVLVNSVKNFTLLYYDSYNDKSPGSTWTSSTKLVGVTLELIGANNISSVFTGKITPRNLP